MVLSYFLPKGLAKVLKNCEISKFLVVFCDFSCIYDKKAVSLQPIYVFFVRKITKMNKYC